MALDGAGRHDGMHQSPGVVVLLVGGDIPHFRRGLVVAVQLGTRHRLPLLDVVPLIELFLKQRRKQAC